MLSRLAKKQVENPQEQGRATAQTASMRIERDFMNIEGTSAKVEIPDKNNLLALFVTVSPTTGIWAGGTFKFVLNFPHTYPIEPPKVLYLGPSRLWHPNIEGEAEKKEWGVCLNILRADWTPVLGLREIIFGLEMMFFEPNLEDPLPGTAKEAARQMRDDPKGFERRAKQWMRGNYS